MFTFIALVFVLLGGLFLLPKIFKFLWTVVALACYYSLAIASWFWQLILKLLRRWR